MHSVSIILPDLDAPSVTYSKCVYGWFLKNIDQALHDSEFFTVFHLSAQVVRVQIFTFR